MTRHASRTLRRKGTGPKARKARTKAATPTPCFVTYAPPPAVVRAPWIPRGPRHVAFAYPSWYVTPSPVKDTQGPEGGTKQGRITVKGPALQTFPDPIIECECSRWPNGILLAFDLVQIELKVAALISGDPTLCAAYPMDGPEGDLHSAMAVIIFEEPFLLERCGAPLNKTNKAFAFPWRDAAKHNNFRGLYRGGADKFQQTVFRKTNGQILLPISYCKRAVAVYPKTYPGLWSWQEGLIALAAQTGRIELPFTGQSRYFEGGSDYEVNEICNFPIQTTAGNELLRLQAFIHHHGPSLNHRRPPFYMTHQVYDAIKFDCRDEAAAAQVRALVREAVAWETTNGYWAALCSHYGRTIPLTYEESHT